MKFKIETLSDDYNKLYYGLTYEDDILCFVMIEDIDKNFEIYNVLIYKAIEVFLKSPIYSHEKLKEIIEKVTNEFLEMKNKNINLELVKLSLCVILSDCNTFEVAVIGGLLVEFYSNEKKKYSSNIEILSMKLYEEEKIKKDDVYKVAQSKIFTNYIGNNIKIKNNSQFSINVGDEIRIKSYNALNKENYENVTNYNVVSIKLVEKMENSRYIKKSILKKILFILIITFLIFISYFMYKRHEIKSINKKIESNIVLISKMPFSKNIQGSINDTLALISLLYSKIFLSNNDKLNLYKHKLDLDNMQRDYEKIVNLLKLDDIDTEISIIQNETISLNKDSILNQLNEQKVKYLVENKKLNDALNLTKNNETKKNIESIIKEEKEKIDKFILTINQETKEELLEKMKDYSKNIGYQVGYNKIEEIIINKKENIKNLEKNLESVLLRARELYYEKNLKESYTEYMKAKEIANNLNKVEIVSSIENEISKVKRELNKYINMIKNTSISENMNNNRKENIQKAKNLEEQANELLKDNKFKQAIDKYKQAIQLLNNDHTQKEYIEKLNYKIKYISNSAGINE